MSTWRETLGAALAGAERHQVDERTIVRQAAELSLKRLAGWTPPSGGSPDWAPSPPERHPVAPPGCLGEILDGNDATLLSEWLSLAANRGWVAPAIHLPALLPRAAATPALREQIQSVLGERGRWLAELNLEWSFAQRLDEAAAWSNGTHAERARALKALRTRDPAAARELLAAGWSREAGTLRATALAVLDVNLSMEDEAFIESALADARKDVRETARDLLASLPNARLATRMRSRAHAYVRFKKGPFGGKLEVNPPAAVDPELVADAIDPKAPAGLGQRAWLLAQVVSLVPPADWPPEMLEPALRSDWSNALWHGLVQASVRFKDPRWTHALLTRSRKAGAPETPSALEAFRALGAADREAIIQQCLGEPDLAAVLIESADHSWSAGLSQTIARRWGQLSARSPSILSRLAYSLNPLVVPELEQALDIQVQEAPAVRAAVERTLRILRFRARMRRELLHT